MLFWLGELARMRRVYDFICVVETKAQLALELQAPGTAEPHWYRSLETAWEGAGRRQLGELELDAPASLGGPVPPGPSPIEFERWLRRIRVRQASSNLSWVFAIRLLFFMATTIGSWTVGVFYVASRDHLALWSGVTAAALGGLFSVITLWLAFELADDLNRASGEKTTISRPRTKFRKTIGPLLRLTEWC